MRERLILSRTHFFETQKKTTELSPDCFVTEYPCLKQNSAQILLDSWVPDLGSILFTIKINESPQHPYFCPYVTNFFGFFASFAILLRSDRRFVVTLTLPYL